MGFQPALVDFSSACSGRRTRDIVLIVRPAYFEFSDRNLVEQVTARIHCLFGVIEK